MWYNFCIVIVLRSVEHPSVPQTRRYVRVKHYSSEMVIKPSTFVDEVRLHQASVRLIITCFLYLSLDFSLNWLILMILVPAFLRLLWAGSLNLVINRWIPLSQSPSIHPFTIHPFIYPFTIHPLIHLFIHPSAHSSIHPSIHPYIQSIIHHLFIHPPSTIHLFIHYFLLYSYAWLPD